VTAVEFMRFLFQWQHVAPGARVHGEAGLLDIVAQLAGFEAAASAWEPHLLRTRLAKYEPELLEQSAGADSLLTHGLRPVAILRDVGSIRRVWRQLVCSHVRRASG
jgi:ATP-dependent helicase Lhr and Lhr-like helicase